jgi:glycosyltransferase involved in cell wall biosynthesis
MEVSVIIPVYRAAEFVKQAVESALMQPETAEIILVEDGSPDNSWEVCQKLAEANPKVQLFRHPDGKNHGAGASRNLGILKSKYEYIAFLDADDFFLPNRFATARVMFESDPSIDGVYEFSGMYIENSEGRERWEKNRGMNDPLHGQRIKVSPDELFEGLMTGKTGFSIDGLVFNRRILSVIGLMDEGLRLHQDALFVAKAASVARLVPGRMDEPVAMWRVHDHNRSSASRTPYEFNQSKFLLWKKLWAWGRTRLKPDNRQLVVNVLIKRGTSPARFKKAPQRATRLVKLLAWVLLLIECPGLVVEPTYWMSPMKILFNKL